MTELPEQVVLVSDAGERVGVADKFEVHTDQTPLHLAFSVHVYDDRGNTLVTRRSLSKLTWPGVWTNSFCGHPAPDESIEEAIARRALFELGITLTDLRVVLPDFRYRAVDASGIVENELCPVYSAVTLDPVEPNPDEVAEWVWVEPAAFATAVASAPFAFSPWLGMQLAQLK